MRIYATASLWTVKKLMQKTKIEWCDYTWNPVVGCRRGCSYCYAKRLNDRFGMIPDFSVPTFFPERLNDKFPKKPSKIFVGSMTDICFWKREWMDEVLKVIRKQPQHTFMFLTKDGSIFLFVRRKHEKSLDKKTV